MPNVDLSQITEIHKDNLSDFQDILSLELNGVEIWGKTYANNFQQTVIGECIECTFVPSCTVCNPYNCYVVHCGWWFLAAAGSTTSYGSPCCGCKALYDNGSWYQAPADFPMCDTWGCTWSYIGNDPRFNNDNIWRLDQYCVQCCEFCCPSFYDCQYVAECELRNYPFWSYRWPGQSGTPAPSCSCYTDL